MVSFLEDSADFEHKYSVTDPRNVTKKSPEPFTTSTLQQKASNNFGYSPKQTMKLAQNLYEAGYITYMRTDSKTYSKDFIDLGKNYIKNKWGEKYISKKIANLITGNKKSPKQTKKKTKKSTKKQDLAQEAHEAIRPTKIEKETANQQGKIGSQESRLYSLIWKNTLESMMEAAVYSSITGEITAPEKTSIDCQVEKVIFKGWKILEKDEDDIELYKYLQDIPKGKILPYHKITSKVTLKDLKKLYRSKTCSNARKKRYWSPINLLITHFKNSRKGLCGKTKCTR